ncbi:serine/threonine protein kinase [Virgisporangium aliadipatigenens]|uniref:serine/threonine protein kinase n=1 Tax=Virgisporangium aliadipatigenens TaxID=741659 RepID=UPI001EF26DFA|nr:serine/threonine protein kinase [Virgisporangium aliadipatigenens]
MSDTPPQVLAGRYRLVLPLGQGGMGRVWRAVDELLLRDVAVKELVLPPAATERDRDDLRERALREARAIARIDQANVVRLFDVVHDGGQPWIVMELIPSRSLQDVLNAHGPVAPARAARIGLGVLAALRAAHRAGILHRDVKPANILLADDGRVVLTDFGVALAAEDTSITVTGIVMGSPQYLAPERATDGMIGPAADLWSLGATLYAAVEGRPPYERSTGVATLTALATERPPPPKQAGVLTAALEGLLRKDPRDRVGPDETERLLRAAAATVPGGRSTVDGPPWWVTALGPVSSGATATVAVPRTPAAPGTPGPAGADGGTAAGDAGPSAPGSGPAGGAGGPGYDGDTWSHPVVGTAAGGRADSDLGRAWGDTDAVRAAAASPTWAAPDDPRDPPPSTVAATGVRRPRRAAVAALLAVPVLALAVAVPLLLTRSGEPSAADSRKAPPRPGGAGGAFPSAAVIPSPVPTAGQSPSRGAAASATPSRAGSPSAARSSAAAPLTPIATDKPIRNVGTGKCIDLPGADRNTTSQIHVWDCFGGTGEAFTLPGDGTLRVLGRCLELDSTATGSAFHIADCTGSDLQRFAMTVGGSLTSVRTGKCLEPKNGDSANGTWLHTWDCTGVDHQKWRVG